MYLPTHVHRPAQLCQDSLGWAHQMSSSHYLHRPESTYIAHVHTHTSLSQHRDSDMAWTVFSLNLLLSYLSIFLLFARRRATIPSRANRSKEMGSMPCEDWRSTNTFLIILPESLCTHWGIYMYIWNFICVHRKVTNSVHVQYFTFWLMTTNPLLAPLQTYAVVTQHR